MQSYSLAETNGNVSISSNNDPAVLRGPTMPTRTVSAGAQSNAAAAAAAAAAMAANNNQAILAAAAAHSASTFFQTAQQQQQQQQHGILGDIFF